MSQINQNDALSGYQEGTMHILIWLVHHYTGRTPDNLRKLKEEVERLEASVPDGCTEEFLAGLNALFRQVKALTEPIGL